LEITLEEAMVPVFVKSLLFFSIPESDIFFVLVKEPLLEKQTELPNNRVPLKVAEPVAFSLALKASESEGVSFSVAGATQFPE
jgi:hypothetical protein